MVLVDPRFRRRGAGTALLRHAIEHLDGKGVRTLLLQATPLGRPLYEKLGFEAEHELARYEGRPAAGPGSALVRPARPEEVESLVELDRAATGTDRGRLIRRLVEEAPHDTRVLEKDGGLLGFLLSRPGAKALQIGPCAAGFSGRSEVGEILLGDAFRRHAGQLVFIDVPLRNAAAVRMAEAHGLAPQRRLLRMRRGEPVLERPESIWASSGPEKG
jgi:predicted N-acetyltransferase YhbS